MHAAGEGPFPENVTMPGDHLRKVFYRMGFNDQEIVALSGKTAACDHTTFSCCNPVIAAQFSSYDIRPMHNTTSLMHITQQCHA